MKMKRLPFEMVDLEVQVNNKEKREDFPLSFFVCQMNIFIICVYIRKFLEKYA